jgi:peptide/nickel transport system substrate-binding protein
MIRQRISANVTSDWASGRGNRAGRSGLRRPLAALVVAGLVFAACSDDDDGDADVEDTAVEETTPPTTTSGDADVEDTAVDDTTSPASSAPTGTDAEAPSAEIDPDGTIIMATVAVPSGLDPHLEVQAGERVFTFQTYDRLTQIGQDMTVQPMLATSWEIADDGLSMTMQLRDDVTFHDGTPFDAEAVVANIERAKTIEGGTAADELAEVTSVEVISPTEVEFTMSAPRYDLADELSGAAGAMLSPTVFADTSIDLRSTPSLAGSGPYMVEGFTPSESVTFVPPPVEYWDADAGQLARLQMDSVPDSRTRFSGLRADEYDLIYIQPLDADNIAEAQTLADSDPYLYLNAPTAVLVANLFKASSEQLSDQAVRSALIQATDRAAIVEGLFQNTCVESAQPIREGFPGHIEGFEDPYPFDPDAATAALAESGVDVNANLHVIAGREQLPSVIQQQWSDIGVPTEITPLTAVEVLTAFFTSEIDMWVYQTAVAVTPTRTVEDFYLNPQWTNATDAELQSLVDEANVTADPDARAELELQMMQIVAERAYLVPICHIDAHYLMDDDIVGFETAMSPTAQFTVDMRYVGRAAS